MSDQFMGEIRTFGFTFAPIGWATCSGQTLPITQNAALFSLLGTSYGGNGTTNFMLPNLGASAPLHAGTGPGLSPYATGDVAGSASVTLTLATMPAHTHSLNVENGNANDPSPAGNFLAKGGIGTVHEYTAYNTYVATNASPPAPPTLAMAAGAIVPVGGNQPHENRQPNLTLNFCIALTGVFPQRP